MTSSVVAFSVFCVCGLFLVFLSSFPVLPGHFSVREIKGTD